MLQYQPTSGYPRCMISGYLAVGGNGVDFNSTGGELDVAGYIYVDSKFVVNNENNGYTAVTCLRLQINASGRFEGYANNTAITTSDDVTYYGTIFVHREATPHFYVGDDWNQVGSGVFKHGQSQVWLEGTSTQYLDVEAYWIVVVNKTFGFGFPSNDGVYIESCLFILAGTFDTFGFALTVNSSAPGFAYNGTNYTGFVNYGGVLRMQFTEDVLDVNGPVTWGPDSQDDIADGTIYCNGSWYFETGSRATLDAGTVCFDGDLADLYMWAWIVSNSSVSHFNDVVVNRDASYGIYLNQWSTETLYVGGDLVMVSGNFGVAHNAMVVNGSVTINSGIFYIDTEFNESLGPVSLDVVGDIYVQSSASLKYYLPLNPGSVTCQNLLVNGSVEYYYGGDMNTSGMVVVQGDVNFTTTSGNGSLNAGTSLTVLSGGVINSELWTNPWVRVTDAMTIESGGNVYWKGGGGMVSGGDLTLSGKLAVGTSSAPAIHIGGDLVASALSVFAPGESTVFFEGTVSNTTIEYLDTFHDIVIEVGNRTLLPTNTHVFANDMDIRNGTYDMNGFNLMLDGDLDCRDRLVMEDDVTLQVNGSMKWYPGSTESVTNGTIVLLGDIYVYDGSDLTFGGTNTMIFSGFGSSSYIYNADDSTRFHDVIVAQSGWLYTHASTAGFTITGDLTVNQTHGWYGLSVSNIHVWVEKDCDVIRGKIYVGWSGNLTVNGTVTVGDGAYLVVVEELHSGELVVSGALYLNGTGAVMTVEREAYVPGSDVIFTANDTYLYVNQDLYVNATAVVNMSGSIRCMLEVGGSLYLYGLLNMTNDLAVLFVNVSIFMFAGSTFD
ncbi:MAG TPA: hypothetical protein EYP43_02765, partial [Thermoplasmata archaeon]|nr:hypothetical protein [Thermoplasmata archaeon]